VNRIAFQSPFRIGRAALRAAAAPARPRTITMEIPFESHDTR
jgi:hypothetical protein